jgi:hypothetical protein
MWAQHLQHDTVIMLAKASHKTNEHCCVSADTAQEKSDDIPLYSPKMPSDLTMDTNASPKPLYLAPPLPVSACRRTFNKSVGLQRDEEMAPASVPANTFFHTGNDFSVSPGDASMALMG